MWEQGCAPDTAIVTYLPQLPARSAYQEAALCLLKPAEHHKAWECSPTLTSTPTHNCILPSGLRINDMMAFVVWSSL